MRLAGWLAIVLVVSAGCGADPTRYYVLTPADVAPVPRATASPTQELRIGIRSVELPRYVERPQIVTRVSPNRLEVAEFQYWGAPLRSAIPMILAENLARLVPTDQVAVFPWGRGFLPDAQVLVEVSQLEGTLGGEVVLAARWRIVDRAGEERAFGVSRLTEAAGEDYENLVAAHSRLVGALSRDIADGLRRGITVTAR
jgi:uncharacterized lipoprotein YmbA